MKILSRVSRFCQRIYTKDRYRFIINSFISGASLRILNIVTNIISLPLIISFLGNEKYGVWIVITTIFTWSNITDLGLNNSLTNSIAEAFSKRDSSIAKKAISTTFYILCGISSLLTLIFLLSSYFLDWSILFNSVTPSIQAESVLACKVAIGIFLINIPLSTIPRILRSYQEPFNASVWLALKSILGLTALVFGVFLRMNLPLLVGCFFGVQALISIFSNVWMFCWHKPDIAPDPRWISYSSLGATFHSSMLFFLLQVSSLLIFQTDNLIISWRVGPEMVADYNVTWRLFSYASLLQGMLFPSLWVSYAEAFSREDHQWVRKTFSRNLRLNLISVCAISVALIFVGDGIIDVWSNGHVKSNQTLFVLMSVWSIIYVLMSSITCLLNAANWLKVQVISSILAAVFNIPFSIKLVDYFGSSGVLVATIFVYMLFVIVPVSIQARSVLQRA